MINCTITSSQVTKVYKDVQSVTLPASTGQMQILSGHAESFVSLQEGNILLHFSNKEDESFQNSGGECHVISDEVTIIL